MKYMLGVLFLFLFNALCGSESMPLLASFNNLSQDVHAIIYAYILHSITEKKHTVHGIDDENTVNCEFLSIPSSLRSMRLANLGVVDEDTDSIIDSNELVIPLEQFWKHDSTPRVRLHNVSLGTNVAYKIGQRGVACNQLKWDGTNSKGTILCSRQFSLMGFNLCLLQQPMEGSQKKIHKKNCIKTKFGYADSIMLHADRNRFVLGYTKDGKHFIEIGDISTIKGKPKASSVAVKQIERPLKKTISFDAKNYLALDEDGALQRVELNEWAREVIIHKQTHPSIILDMAFDKHSVTPEGVIHTIAFMSNRGEIFVTDMRLFSKPTMVLVRTIPEYNNAILYYEDHKIGVMLTRRSDQGFEVVDRLTVFADCYELVYLKSLLKKVCADS